MWSAPAASAPVVNCCPQSSALLRLPHAGSVLSCLLCPLCIAPELRPAMVHSVASGSDFLCRQPQCAHPAKSWGQLCFVLSTWLLAIAWLWMWRSLVSLGHARLHCGWTPCPSVSEELWGLRLLFLFPRGEVGSESDLQVAVGQNPPC